MAKAPSKATVRKSPVKNSPAGSVSLQRKVAAANKWRENYNPLRSLVMTRVVALLECGERGEFAELQWLYRFIEKRFPTLRGLIKRWRGAMGKLDWEIKIKSELPEGATETMAEAQQKTLRARYELVDNLRQAIDFLVLAEFRGYSLVNKHREIGGENDGAVKHLEIIDQWNWVRDGLNGGYYHNPASAAASAEHFKSLGQPEIRPGHPDFIIAEEDMPVNEIAVIQFLRYNLCSKDWDAFIELFGIERPVIIGPPNVPKEKEEEYLSAAERIANGEPGYLPNGSTAEYPNQRGGGGDPFLDRLKRIDEELVLAGTGGLMSMLAMPTGIGDGPSKEHADGFAELAQLKARDLSELFQKQFDLEVLNEAHPNEPKCVYFELCAPDEEDVQELVQNVATLKTAGFTADAKELSEKTGLTLVEVEVDTTENTEDTETDAGKKSAIRNRQSAIPAPATAAEALQHDMALPLTLLDIIKDHPDQVREFLNREPRIREALKNASALKQFLTTELEKEFSKGLKE